MKPIWHKLVILGLSGFSFYLTGSGLAEVLRGVVGGAGGFSETLEQIGIGAGASGVSISMLGYGFSAMVQGLIVWAYSTVFADGIARRPLELVIGLLGSALSGAFASASLSSMFIAADLDQVKRADATLPVIELLDASATQAAGWSSEYTVLASRAADLAGREAATGGTCENDPSSGSSCGPRCNWRNRQAELFADLANAANAYSTQAGEVALTVQTAARAEVPGVFASAKAAERQIGASLAVPLSRALAEMEDGFADPTNGTRYICRNAGFEAATRALLATIEARELLPARMPHWTDAGFSDAAAAVVLSVFDLITGAEPRVPESQPYIAFAYFMEVVLTLLNLSARADDRRQGRIPSAWEVYMDNARTLSPVAPRRIERVARAIDRYRVNAGRGRQFLALPTNGTPTEAFDDIRTAIAFFRLTAVADVVDLSTVDPVWWLPRERELGGATLFEVYPLPRNYAEWSSAALRDVEHTRGDQVSS